MYSILLFFALYSGEHCQVYGDIQFVQYGEDYKVYIQQNNNVPDLRVIKVKRFPNKTGLWSIGEKTIPDFKIKIVNNKADADFTIKFVELNPRCY